MSEFASATPFQRIQMIADALAKVLDRDETMEVASYGTVACDQCVWVWAYPYSDVRIGHDLFEIARELEVLLS